MVDWLSQAHRHGDMHSPPHPPIPPPHQYTRSPPHHTQNFSLTHTPTLTPRPEGSSLAQMIRSRLLMASMASGRWWIDEQPDRAGMGQGLSAFCEVVSRKAPWELPV